MVFQVKLYKIILFACCFLLFSCKTQSLKNTAGYGGGWAEAKNQTVSKLADEKLPELSNNSRDSSLNPIPARLSQKVDLAKPKPNIWHSSDFENQNYRLLKPKNDSATINVLLPKESNLNLAFKLMLSSLALGTISYVSIYLDMFYFIRTYTLYFSFISYLIYIFAFLLMVAACAFAWAGLHRYLKKPTKYRRDKKVKFTLLISTSVVILYLLSIYYFIVHYIGPIFL